MNFINKVRSKLAAKIAIIIIVEIILILASFGIVAYFDSEKSSIGHSINAAGRNRILGALVIDGAENYPNKASSINLNNLIKDLDRNLLVLKDGGIIPEGGSIIEGGSTTALELKHLPQEFVGDWEMINSKWLSFKTIVVKLTASEQRGFFDVNPEKRKEMKMAGLEFIDLSDKLTNSLGKHAVDNSRDMVILEITLGMLNIAFHVFMLYFILRILKPVSLLTQATQQVREGNLDISVKVDNNKDELSILTASFNLMINSLRIQALKQKELNADLTVANAELKRRDKIKDEFINIAAHELRTPLQPIISFNELASQGLVDKEEALKIIDTQAKRLKKLASDILLVSRLETNNLSYNFEFFKINDLINDVIKEATLDKEDHTNVKLVLELERDVLIQADRTRLAQVLVNLIENSYKFTKEGQITVRTSISASENKIDIYVIDTGLGIPLEMMPKLFEKFVTKSIDGENKEGTGLGLYICKAIVMAHNGEIMASNNASGMGATFKLTLPITQESN